MAIEIVCVIAPVLHNQDVPVPAVKLTEPPAQNVVADPAVMFAAGKVFTVTVVGIDVAEQPLALVIVTLYVPPVLTTIFCVVAPVLQR